MRRVHIVTWLWALLPSLWLFAATAEAHSYYRPDLSLLYPRQEQTGVSTHTKIWIGAKEAADPSFSWEKQPAVRLYQPEVGFVDGRETVLYEGASEPSWRRFIRVFSPTKPLAPGTLYAVRIGDRVVTTFTTGAEESAPPPPALPRIFSQSVVAKEFYPRSGPAVNATIQLTSSPGLVIVVPEAGISSFDAQRLSGTPTLISLGNIFTIDHHQFPDVQLGSTVRFRYAAVDFADGFSDWSMPVEVTFPTQYTPWHDPRTDREKLRDWLDDHERDLKRLGVAAVFFGCIIGMLVCIVEIVRRLLRARE